MMDRATFYASLRGGTLFDKGLSQRQVTGMEAKLDMWDRLGFTDTRWLAYGMATSYHETGRAMYPVREGDLGKGHPYGVPSKYNGQIAYGRGDVQLTWATDAEHGYPRADAELAKHGIIQAGALLANFDLALDPQISAAVLWLGMTEAWFTKFKLSDYLNATTADYLHCRRIVNGMDQAAKIAGYATIFYAAITAGEHAGTDKTVAIPRPVPVPVPTAAPAPVSAPSASSDPISNILGEIVDLGTSVFQPSGTSSPAAPAPSSAATESSNPMNPVSIIASLLEGVVSKLGVASTVATALPHLIEGTISNIQEVPKAIADFQKLISDIQGGKWSNVPDDVHALLTEAEKIISNYGINLSALTGMVNALPATPAVTSAPVNPTQIAAKAA